MAQPNATAPVDGTTRNLPPLSIRASVRPGSIDPEKRTAEMVWTTGERVLRGWFDQWWEELSLDPAHVRMGRLNSGRAPMLDSHDMHSGVSSVIGVVESARLGKAEGTAVVRFAKAEDDPEADKVFRKVKDGIIANVSVGYRVFKYELIESGDGQVPVYRAVDWEPFELSPVPVGADADAGFRSAQHAAPNPCIFVQRQEKPMENEKPATAAADPAAATTQTGDATRAAEAAGQLAERTRISEIQDAARVAKLPDAFAAQHVQAGTKVDEVRKLIFVELAKRDAETRTDSHVTVVPGGDEHEKFMRGAGAWLFEKAGASSLIADAGKKERALAGVELNGGEFRGMSLVDVARECLERRGVPTRRMSSKDIVGRAFTFRAGGQSTSDFAVLFENAIGKILLGAYALAPNVWSLFCKSDTVSDFRPSPRFRTGSLGVLEEVNEAGEFPQIVMPDGVKYSVSTGTKGKILALTRQAIINDDMGALADAAQKLGRAAQLSIELDVFALLLANAGLGPTQSDGQPFFHANRANVNAAPAALSVVALDADRVVMRKQKDPNNQDFLDLRPAVLVVSAEEETTAKLLNSAPYDPADAKFQKPNTAQNMFRTVVGTPRLAGKRRYLFADPNDAAAIVVAFLEGQGNAPVLESQEGWRTDGTEWKVRHDYRAQTFDPKGGVTNAGQ
jgi:HK97 family phage prohead protease